MEYWRRLKLPPTTVRFNNQTLDLRFALEIYHRKALLNQLFDILASTPSLPLLRSVQPQSHSQLGQAAALFRRNPPLGPRFVPPCVNRLLLLSHHQRLTNQARVALMGFVGQITVNVEARTQDLYQWMEPGCRNSYTPADLPSELYKLKQALRYTLQKKYSCSCRTMEALPQQPCIAQRPQELKAWLRLLEDNEFILNRQPVAQLLRWSHNQQPLTPGQAHAACKHMLRACHTPETMLEKDERPFLSQPIEFTRQLYLQKLGPEYFDVSDEASLIPIEELDQASQCVAELQTVDWNDTQGQKHPHTQEKQPTERQVVIHKKRKLPRWAHPRKKPCPLGGKGVKKL